MRVISTTQFPSGARLESQWLCNQRISWDFHQKYNFLNTPGKLSGGDA